MVVLRPTRKLAALLPPSAISAESDAALGDWYVNRLVVDRRPLLLLVSSASLLSILEPARDVRGLATRLGGIVETRLRRLGLDDRIVAREREAMFPVVLAPTASRSVLGTMVDFAKTVPFCLEPWIWTPEALLLAEDRLAEMPCRLSLGEECVIVPQRRAPELLLARWRTDTGRRPASNPTTVH